MSQMIYSILALVLLMILSFNMQRGIKSTAQGQSINEVLTQLPGVGTEALEQIGRSYFDRHAFDQRNTKPYCGRVADDETFNLSAPAGANFGACADFATCSYIEGFHGLDTTITRGEFDFAVHVDTVQYVDPADFSVTPGTVTFAKRVQVTVENPYLYLGDDPTNTFSLTMDRVFTYACVTDPNKIPYVRESETCPAPPVCATIH